VTPPAAGPGDRWEEVDRHFARLLELAPAARAAALARLGHDDPELQDALGRLLEASERSGHLEDGPAPALLAAALRDLSPEDPCPDRIGPYRVIRRLGRGGTGSVFLAELDEPTFPNRVALKLLRKGLDTDDVIARFRTERRILASLHHPGIARVIDAGSSEDGRPWLALEHVEGATITEHCASRGLDVRARIGLFMAVARAVSYAHERGVVHRDIKPSNILVTDAEAHVKLLDFGIAKLVETDAWGADARTTRPGSRMMTPGFASPEQLQGGHVAEPSDIYQLGLLLHELLTGRHPFGHLPPDEFVRAVTTTDPEPPSRALRTRAGPPGDAHTPAPVARSLVRSLARTLSGDLDAILLRCLRRDPAARFARVQDLHDDLARFLDGRPVTARRATAVYRLRTLVRRRARWGVVPAAAVALLTLGVVRSDDGLALADRASVPSGGTVNEEARRLYVEGLSAFHQGDNRVADRLFRAALRIDSSFAMAAFHAAQTTDDYDRHAGFQLLNLARTLSHGAAERDRLLIQAEWAVTMNDPVLEALSESLSTRFGNYAPGHLLRGTHLSNTGRFAEAIPHFERAVALDSLGLHAERAPCVSCDALQRIVTAYLLADSPAEAVATAERWAALQPASSRPWHALASAWLYTGEFERALEARGRAAALRVGNTADLLFPGVVALHRGELDEADRLFRLHARDGTPEMRRSALWWLVIGLRNQGRFAEALDASRALFEASRDTAPPAAWRAPGTFAMAQVLMEGGRHAEAADLFESLALGYDEYSASRQARNDTWVLTHAGTARAAAGDTAALARLADSVEVLGARSGYGRDRRLHHYLRALLERSRGGAEQAVEAHLRAALYSLPGGFSRINLELAGSLLRQGRHREAAAVAGAPLRYSSESNGIAATRTDVHELLGRIHDSAGARDSAVAHYRAAAEAWHRGDAVVRPRLDRVRARLAALSAPPA
jgi:serine/threonine protein kinase